MAGTRRKCCRSVYYGSPPLDCRRVYGYPPLVRLAPPGRLVDRLLPLLVGRLSRPVVLNPTIYIGFFQRSG